MKQKNCLSPLVFLALLSLCLMTPWSPSMGQSWAWQTTFGGVGSEGLSALAANNLGPIFGGSYDQAFSFLGQNVPSPSNRDLLVGQLDQNGDLLWLESPGSLQTDRLAQVRTTPEANTWWLGDFWETLTWGDSIWAAPNDGQAIFLVQTDASGQVLEHRTVQGSASIEAIDMVQDEAAIYLLGTFTGSLNIGNQSLTTTADRAGFLAKLDLENGWQWGIALDGVGLIRPTALSRHDEGLYVVGAFNDTLQNSTAQLVAETWDWDGFVASYSTDGEALWLQKVGAQYDDFLQSISINSDGHLFVAGTFLGVLETENGWSVQTPGFNTNVLWLELDASGNPLKLTTWGNLAEEESLTLQGFQTGALLTGRMGPSMVLGTQAIAGEDGLDNGFLAGISTEGRVNWGVSLQATELILATEMALSPSGDIYVGGAFQGELMLDSILDNAGQFDGFMARLAPAVLPAVENPLGWSVKVSPNPSNGVFFLEAPLGAQYRLLTTDGILLEAGELRSAQALFQQERGSYFLEIQWKGRTVIEKIIVQ
ncbi:MAG: T9SS type A sorting domain-containing protein [Bacteroidota bacterium]